jgi:hypothetical protein
MLVADWTVNPVLRLALRRFSLSHSPTRGIASMLMGA